VISTLSQEAGWGRRLILGVCGAILVFAPLAYGAVHTWAYCTIGLTMGALSLILLAYGLYLVMAKPLEIKALPYPPVWWLAAGLVLVLFLQITPLPQGMVKWLSPTAWQIRALGNGFGLADNIPLSLNPYATLLEGLKLWPAVCLFFILIYTVNSRQQILGLVWLILAVAFFEILYGFWQFRSNMIWGWKNPYTGNRLCGTFINSNHLAILLAMSILLGFGLFLSQKGSKAAGSQDVYGWMRLKRKSRAEHLEPQFQRLILLFFLLFLTVGLIFTGSRGGMAALIVGFALMGLFIRSQRWKQGNLILMMIFLSASLLYSLFLGSAQALSRFQNLVDWDRYMAFKGAIKIFTEFPLVGSGLATFGDVFYKYEPVNLKGVYFIYTHSDWLQLLAETGLLGFLLVTVAWLSFFSKMAQQWRRRQNRFARGLGLGCLAVLGAGAFHALAEFPFHIPALCMLYGSIAAIAYLTLYSHRQEDLEFFSYPGNDFGNFQKPWGMVLFCLLPLQLTFLIQVSYYGLAERASPKEIDSTRLSFPLTAGNFREALAFSPKNSKYYLGLAETLEKAESEAALAEVEHALKSAIYFAPAHWGYRQKLAEFSLRYNQIAPEFYIPQGLKELDTAVKLFPESARINLYLGTSLVWADKYYSKLVPEELQGKGGNYLDKAFKLDPKVK
jgi:O-antigen ligase